MAPSVTLDTESDFNPPKKIPSAPSSSQRTLLLSPPSLSSHPEKLDKVLAAHDRSLTDMQMLDRLSLSLVSLPESTYDIILILLDADTTRAESQTLLTRNVLLRIVKALKPGGRLQSQDGKYASQDSEERREAIFAGLVIDANGLIKPSHDTSQTVPLRFGKKKNENGATAFTSAVGTGAVSLNLNGKRKNGPPDPSQPAGVGFVDFSDDFDVPVDEADNDDDELIDENTLLDDDDFSRPIIQRKHPFLLPPPSPLILPLIPSFHLQHQPAAPQPASAAAHAKTAAAASRSGSKPKTPPSAQRPTRT